MIDRTQFLKEIANRDPHLAMILDDLFTGLDGVANHAGFDPKGKVHAPDPLSGLNVKAGSDHVHVTITDNSRIKKNASYFVEYSVNDPSFSQPHVEDLGHSRGRILALPARDDSNTPINYYFKAYSQYPGSDPQPKHVFFGTRLTPTAVTLSGSSKMSPLASTGSGTGRPDGTQSGAGRGIVLKRPAQGPKRPAAPSVTL